MWSQVCEEEATKLVHLGLKTGQRGPRKSGEDKEAKSPWRGLKDRQTDRITSTEIVTKGLKHTDWGSAERQRAALTAEEETTASQSAAEHRGSLCERPLCAPVRLYIRPSTGWITHPLLGSSLWATNYLLPGERESARAWENTINKSKQVKKRI